MQHFNKVKLNFIPVISTGNSLWTAKRTKRQPIPIFLDLEEWWIRAWRKTHQIMISDCSYKFLQHVGEIHIITCFAYLKITCIFCMFKTDQQICLFFRKSKHITKSQRNKPVHSLYICTQSVPQDNALPHMYSIHLTMEYDNFQPRPQLRMP